MFGLYASDIGAVLIILAVAAFLYLFWRQAQRTFARKADQIPGKSNLEERVAQRTLELNELATHLQQVHEEEKDQLARTLHGELGSTLLAARMDIEAVIEKLRQSQPELALRLQRAHDTLQQAVAIKRELTDKLRPGLLENLGFAVAVEWEVAEAGRRAALNASVDVSRDTAGLPPEMAMSTFRAVQEAVENATRHARARNLWVEITAADSNLSVLVEDDGIGIADSALQSHLSHGLAGIRHRVRAMHGECLIRRRPEGGTVVEINLPLPAAAEK